MYSCSSLESSGGQGERACACEVSSVAKCSCTGLHLVGVLLVLFFF